MLLSSMPWRHGGIDPQIFNISIRWSEWVLFTFWPLYPWGKNWRLVVPGVGLDVVEKKQITDPISKQTLVMQPVTSHYIDWAIPVLVIKKDT
jgi:hypothetical protein